MDVYIHPDFPAHQIALGKYTRWAENLPRSALIRLLELLGRDYAALVHGLRPPKPTSSSSISSLTSPPTSPPAPSVSLLSDEKVSSAVLHLGDILRTNVPCVMLASGFQDEFSIVLPAFSDKFRQDLATRELAAWASPLTQRSFAMLLWMVDQFKCRFDENKLPLLMSELAVRDKVDAAKIRNVLIELGGFGQS